MKTIYLSGLNIIAPSIVRYNILKQDDYKGTYTLDPTSRTVVYGSNSAIYADIIPVTDARLATSFVGALLALKKQLKKKLNNCNEPGKQQIVKLELEKVEAELEKIAVATLPKNINDQLFS